MTKIMIRVSYPYVSIDDALFVSFISVDFLILNSRGIKYKVGIILPNTFDNLVAEAVQELRFRSRHNRVY